MKIPERTFDHFFIPKITIHSTWFDNLSDEFEWLYRITDGSGGMCFFIAAYKILRDTPKGCWIDHYGTEKFINFSHKKRFAHSTFEEALQSYVKRKEKQVEILIAQLENAQNCKENIKKISLEDIKNATNNTSTDI